MSRLSERIENFYNAFKLYEEVRNEFIKDKQNNTNRLALAQGFEIVCELGWKVLKDYLYENGIKVQLPKEVIKEAFSKDVISNGQIWIDMIEDRNSTLHEYNTNKVDIVLEKAGTVYYDELLKFKKWLESINE